MYGPLREVLRAYITYRTDVGYVRILCSKVLVTCKALANDLWCRYEARRFWLGCSY
jgi:hypothetical protein